MNYILPLIIGYSNLPSMSLGKLPGQSGLRTGATWVQINHLPRSAYTGAITKPENYV